MGSTTPTRAGTRFGKYRLVRLLGRGGMGEVYEAVDTEKGRTVALKILLEDYSADQDYRRRFTREAHAAAQLAEPHVIPIHDWGEIDTRLYIDMRLVHGDNLRDVLAAGPLEPARAVAVCTQVAEALDAAHAGGVIHRDVKPENIIVADGDFAYLLDFGIAEQAGETRLTKAGMTVGSLAYLAPERLGGGAATASVDVYGLACVLFECLTGRQPFLADTLAQVMTEHLYAPPPAPSAVVAAVPTAFDAVIARGMAKQPDDRYGSAGALVRAAARALSPPARSAAQSAYPTMAAAHVQAATEVRGAVAAPPPAAPPVPAGPPGWLLPTLIAAGVVVLAAVGITLGVLIGQSSTPQSTAPPSSPRLSPSPPMQPAPTLETTRAPVLPPAVHGPDTLGASCDTGFVHGAGDVFGSRALRGSAETSCVFTRNVLAAYWRAGPATETSREIAAPGSRPCGESGDTACTRDGEFVMRCAVRGTDDWITCEGGNNARVYLY